MLAAWEWWQVSPLRLPTSIRYLDTFAQQGGATDRLVIEYEFAFEQGSKAVYRATKPANGYGVDLLTLQTEPRPPEADWQSLEVTVVFGSPDSRRR
ncbi:MAG: hypothetical protein OXG44_17630, partial [Gammaproteobacteria bacterium]|nr:hypothetical protein [Gammaproteobacteria bacterium]